MELLAKLGINWGLLLAQIMNFSLLMGVLGAFLYKPILRLLDDRREMIRRSVEDAKKVEEQIKDLERIRSEHLTALDRECGELLARTKLDAERSKQEILTLAQREADRMLEKGRASLAEERSQVMREVSATLSAVIVRATEAIIRREFSDADQKRLVRSLEDHLTHLQG